MSDNGAMLIDGIVAANWRLDIELVPGRFYLILLTDDEHVQVGRMEGWSEHRPVFSFIGDKPERSPDGRASARIVGETLDPTRPSDGWVS